MSDTDHENDPQPPQAPLPDDVLEGLRNLIDGQADGDKDNALRLLYNDNQKLREKNRELRDEMPGEEEVVLSGEDATDYKDLRDVGGPREVLDQLKEGQEAQKELARRERTDTLRDVAEAEDANLDVLKDLAGDETFEIRTETNEDDDDIQRAYVKENDETKPLREHFRLHEDSLFGTSSGDDAGSSDAQAAATTTRVPNQRPSGNPPSDEKTDDEIKREQQKRHKFSI